MSDITSVPRAGAAVTEVWQPIALPQGGPQITDAESALEEMGPDWTPVGYRVPEVWEAADWVQVDRDAASPEEQAIYFWQAQADSDAYEAADELGYIERFADPAAEA